MSSSSRKSSRTRYVLRSARTAALVLTGTLCLQGCVYGIVRRGEGKGWCCGREGHPRRAQVRCSWQLAQESRGGPWGAITAAQFEQLKATVQRGAAVALLPPPQAAPLPLPQPEQPSLSLGDPPCSPGSR